MLRADEPVLVVSVKCEEPFGVSGENGGIVMIPFTGTSESPYFKGKILGTGVDTQKISEEGKVFLSARYMLDGTDYSGQKCRIFIENQGSDMSACKPTVVTDSKALSELETAVLRSVVELAEGGVTVKIYKEE